MNRKMNLRLDESGLPESGPGAFDPSPLPVWAEIDEGSWRIALQFRSRGGQPVLTEVRVFPVTSDARPGCWFGDVSAVEEGGLRPKLVKDLAIGRLRNQAIQYLTDPTDRFWADNWPNAWENWFDIANYAGIEANAEADVPGTPGRQPISSNELALVAKYYTEGMGKGVKSTHEYIREQMIECHGEFLSAGTIGGRIHKARARGFLTYAEKKGKRGGVLTLKARDQLRKIDQEGQESR